MLVHLGPAQYKIKGLRQLERGRTIVVVQLTWVTLNNLDSLSKLFNSVLCRLSYRQLQIFKYLLEFIRADCNPISTFAKLYRTIQCLLMRCDSKTDLNLVYKIVKNDVRVYLLFTVVSILYENKHSCQNLSDIVFILHLECRIESSRNQNLSSFKYSGSRCRYCLWISGALRRL